MKLRSGSTPIVKSSGWREELHPRGYHGHFAGSVLKRQHGSLVHVHAKDSGEKIGSIHKTDRTLNIRPRLREKYHTAKHRGVELGHFDREKDAHSAITEAERLHRGLGPSIEHARITELSNEIHNTRNSRTIALAESRRYQRQSVSGKITPEQRALLRDRANAHDSRAGEHEVKLNQLEEERRLYEKNLNQRGGTPDTGRNLTEGNLRQIASATVPAHANELQRRIARGRAEVASAELNRRSASTPEPGAPTTHAHQVGTIVQFKNPSSVLAGANQYRVAESRPEGVVLTGRRREGGTSKLYGHEQVEPVPRPIDWSNTEVAQHERNLRGKQAVPGIDQAKLNEEDTHYALRNAADGREDLPGPARDAVDAMQAAIERNDRAGAASAAEDYIDLNEGYSTPEDDAALRRAFEG